MEGGRRQAYRQGKMLEGYWNNPGKKWWDIEVRSWQWEWKDRSQYKWLKELEWSLSSLGFSRINKILPSPEVEVQMQRHGGREVPKAHREISRMVPPTPDVFLTPLLLWLWRGNWPGTQGGRAYALAGIVISFHLSLLYVLAFNLS